MRGAFTPPIRYDNLIYGEQEHLRQMIALSTADLITSIPTQCKKHSQLLHVPLVSSKTEPQRPSINNLFLMLFFFVPIVSYPVPCGSPIKPSPSTTRRRIHPPGEFPRRSNV
jgi:hypothetical protein